MTRSLFTLTHFTLISVLFAAPASATKVTLYNKCPHPVWPGIHGNTVLAGGGFELPPNNNYTLRLPPSWNGRFWGRYGCSFDASGRGRCDSGDCGGSLFCNGTNFDLPVTMVAVSVGIMNDQEFYDVSVVDGYNLAISITALKGKGKCSFAGCLSDLNLICPVGLQVRSGDNRRVIACKSPCLAFNSPRYCCTGSFTPEKCKPTAYSRIFKTACPRAYTYPFDDTTSFNSCSGGEYLVTFCPVEMN